MQGLTLLTGNARLPAGPLVDFEDQQGLAREKCKVLLARAEAKYNALSEEFEDRYFVPVKGDRFVSEMVSCLPDIEAMLQMSNDAGAGLGLALVMFLARHSHGDINTRNGAGS